MGCSKLFLPETSGRHKVWKYFQKQHRNSENVKFVIVGDGRNKENFLEEIKHWNVPDKFIMIDRQPQEKIPELLACDAAFVSFMDNEL